MDSDDTEVGVNDAGLGGTWKGSTDDRYDTSENRQRAEQHDEDAREAQRRGEQTPNPIHDLLHPPAPPDLRDDPVTRAIQQGNTDLQPDVPLIIHDPPGRRHRSDAAAPPYAGRVLYLRLSPYVGSTKYIRYWIDPAGGRIRYEEMMPPAGNIRASVNGVPPVKPSPPTWFVVSLARQADGRCAITYTTLLDSSERGQELPCASLLAPRAAAMALLRRVKPHIFCLTKSP